MPARIGNFRVFIGTCKEKRMKRWYLHILAGLFLALAMASSFGTFAQPKYGGFVLREVVPFGDQGFAAIFLDDLKSPRAMRLNFFTPDNQSAFEEIIPLERQGIRAKFEGAFAWNGRLQVLTSLYYPGPKRNHLLLQQFAVPDFQTTEALLVDEAYTPELYRVPFGYALSPDNTKVMFYSWTYTLPEDPARVTITVMDQQLDTLWKQRYVLPYKNESLYIYSSRLTDDGRAFLLCENYTGKVGAYIDESKIDYFVLGAENGEENMLIYDLNPAGKTLRGLHIDPAPGNAMSGAAFYQDPGKEIHLGVYFFHIPPAGGKMTQTFIPIDKETYQSAFLYPGGDGIFNANRHRFESYAVNKTERLPDGSVLIFAQQEYYQRTENVFEYNDVLVMRIQPELNRLEWIRRVPKRQAETYNENVFSPFSYKLMPRGDRWYLLFNDLADNHASPGNQRSLDRYWGEDGVMIAAEITIGGQVTLYNLTRLLRSKSIARIWTTHCWDLGPRELLVFGEGPTLLQNFLVGVDWEELRKQPSLKWEN